MASLGELSGELSASSLNRPRAQEGAPIDECANYTEIERLLGSGQMGDIDGDGDITDAYHGAEVGAEGSPDDREPALGEISAGALNSARPSPEGTLDLEPMVCSLGAGAGSKATAMIKYMIKYMGKDCVEISSSASVLLDAHAHIKDFPSGPSAARREMNVRIQYSTV